VDAPELVDYRTRPSNLFNPSRMLETDFRRHTLCSEPVHDIFVPHVGLRARVSGRRCESIGGGVPSLWRMESEWSFAASPVRGLS